MTVQNEIGRTMAVGRDLLAERRAEAAKLRAEMAHRGTLVVHLVSSPGAGKTTLLQATARQWQGRFPLAVLVGDLETDRDAQRLAPYAPTEQLTTGGACHLELPLVQRGLERLGLTPPDDQAEATFTPRDAAFLFIENVGNLVCPAGHDLGEHLRVVLLSATEGDDKPGKYPKLFRTSHALVVTKIDLLPHVPFSVPAALADARRIQPELTCLALSGLSGEGVDSWCDWLVAVREKLLAGVWDLAPRR